MSSRRSVHEAAAVRRDVHADAVLALPDKQGDEADAGGDSESRHRAGEHSTEYLVSGGQADHGQHRHSERARVRGAREDAPVGIVNRLGRQPFRFRLLAEEHAAPIGERSEGDESHTDDEREDDGTRAGVAGECCSDECDAECQAQRRDEDEPPASGGDA
jgi:hypothetical protein